MQIIYSLLLVILIGIILVVVSVFCRIIGSHFSIYLIPLFILLFSGIYHLLQAIVLYRERKKQIFEAERYLNIQVAALQTAINLLDKIQDLKRWHNAAFQKQIESLEKEYKSVIKTIDRT